MRGAAVAMANDMSFIADGDVELTVRLGENPTLDVSIGDWQGYNLTDSGEIGRPTAVSIEDLDVVNETINADGTFGGDNLGGTFYGPGGVEAAGIFATNGYRGAFGVRKPKK